MRKFKNIIKIKKEKYGNLFIALQGFNHIHLLDLSWKCQIDKNRQTECNQEASYKVP